jgi:hypothetical protein
MATTWINKMCFPNIIATTYIYIPPPRRERTSETKNWEYIKQPVETMEEFICHTGVSSEFNVLPLMRREEGLIAGD